MNVASSVPEHRARQNLAKNVPAQKPQHSAPYRVISGAGTTGSFGSSSSIGCSSRSSIRIEGATTQASAREAGGAHQRERRRVIQKFERRAVVARRQNVLQRTRVQPAEAQAANQFLVPVR